MLSVRPRFRNPPDTRSRIRWVLLVHVACAYIELVPSKGAPGLGGVHERVITAQ